VKLRDFAVKKEGCWRFPRIGAYLSKRQIRYNRGKRVLSNHHNLL